MLSPKLSIGPLSLLLFVNPSKGEHALLYNIIEKGVLILSFVMRAYAYNSIYFTWKHYPQFCIYVDITSLHFNCQLVGVLMFIDTFWSIC